MKREDIYLTIGGSIAAIAVAYLLYRLQQRQSAVAAANSEANDLQIEQELASQQAVAASTVAAVPAISSTPSTTDTTNQSVAPADYSGIENIVSAFQSQDNSSVTSQVSPTATLGLVTSTIDPSNTAISSTPANSISTPIVSPSGVTNDHIVNTNPNETS